MSKNIEIISGLMNEINYLQQCEQYLHQIMNYLSPYDRKINGKDCGSLIDEIFTNIYDFDDGE